MEITYKQVTDKEIPLLINGIVAFALEYNQSLEPEQENKLRYHLTEYLNEAIPNKTFIGWYAEAENKIAGVGGLNVRQQPPNIKNFSGRVGYLFSMYTVPEYRRKGICKTLVDKLLESAQEIGITAFELHATEEGEFVYKKSGFIIHNEPTYRKFIHHAV
jgi:ribosomal protein S18 acetylase RimI-like enzyme